MCYKLQKTGMAVFLILSFISLVLVCTVPVSAISILGSKYVAIIPAGGTGTFTMTVGIGSDENPADVMAGVMGFGQTLQKVYSPLDVSRDVNPETARPFITLSGDKFHLEPGTTQDITATITLPKNVGEGGRYALIYIHALPGSGQTFTTAITVPVMITVSDTTQTKTGNITNLEVGDVTVGQPISITTTLKNTGNSHYYHTVNTVSIANANGNTIASFSTPSSPYAIIPGNTVQYLATPDVKNLTAGTYTVDSRVLLDDGSVLDQKTTSFTIKTNYIPPATESSITLTPGSSATLVSSDGRYTVSFPQGSVYSDVTLTIRSYPKNKLRPAPDGAIMGSSSLEIAGLQGLLAKDATIQVAYSDDDLLTASGDGQQLKLAYFDTISGSWVILPTQVDLQAATLTSTTNHLGILTVLASSSVPAAAASSAEVPVQIPMTIVIALAALIAIIVIVIIVTKLRK